MSWVYDDDTSSHTKVMTAILLTAGPINTLQAFGKIVHQSLRHTKRASYIEAGEELERLGVVRMTATKAGANIIIKMPPTDVWHIVEDLGLCKPEQYDERYNCPIPKSITETVKKHVIAEGYFDEL